MGVGLAGGYGGYCEAEEHGGSGAVGGDHAVGRHYGLIFFPAYELGVGGHAGIARSVDAVEDAQRSEHQCGRRAYGGDLATTGSLSHQEIGERLAGGKV